MPKVTMSFNLPEEETDLKLAQRGHEYFSALFLIDQRCREILKYKNPSKETSGILEELRELISQLPMDDVE